MSAQWSVVQCDACGGAVAFDPATALVRCVFCAALALRPVLADAPPGAPREVLPFELAADGAQDAFGRWTRGSFWRPRALRDAQASLVPLWLPAWRVGADVELHWAALVHASTRSGKRPRTGTDRGRAQCIVPASGAVTGRELAGLQPFATATRPWQDDDHDVPCELPALSEDGAIAAAYDLLVGERLRHVSRVGGLSDAGGTARLHEVETRLDALPLWIGSFVYRDRSWRVVVNGSTGKVVGDAPIDRVKVAVAIVLAVLVALLLARCERDRPEPEITPIVAAGPDTSHHSDR